METNVKKAFSGAAGAAVAQGMMQRYGDRFIAPMLYSSTQYAVDLKKAGYVPTSMTVSDAEIGAAIVSSTGYEFTPGSPTNLVGPNKRTATMDTYMAAVGQKVAPYTLPSFWGSAGIGVIGLIDSDSKDSFLGLNKYKVEEAAMSGGLLGAAVIRMVPGLTGVKAYPSGFDIIATSTMQYMDQSAIQNLQRLTADNNNLRNELAQLRAAKTAQYPRGMPPGIPSYSVNSQQPVVQVSEIIPGKGAEAIKERTGIMGFHKATAESVKHQTGLVTLTGGR